MMVMVVMTMMMAPGVAGMPGDPAGLRVRREYQASSKRQQQDCQ